MPINNEQQAPLYSRSLKPTSHIWVNPKRHSSNRNNRNKGGEMPMLRKIILIGYAVLAAILGYELGKAAVEMDEVAKRHKAPLVPNGVEPNSAANTNIKSSAKKPNGLKYVLATRS